MFSEDPYGYVCTLEKTAVTERTYPGRPACVLCPRRLCSLALRECR